MCKRAVWCSASKSCASADKRLANFTRAPRTAAERKQWLSGVGTSALVRRGAGGSCVQRKRGHPGGTDGEMYCPISNPSKAAEYLQELNRIVDTQQDLLHKQGKRIGELEQQVCVLRRKNSCLTDNHLRHLATCSLRPATAHPRLGAIKEHVIQGK